MPEKLKFYLDEHVPPDVANGLRRYGIDVLTTVEAGRRGAADLGQLAFASEQGRVIFTHDSDYLKLHSQGVTHAGIVYSPRQKSIGDIISSLLLLYQVYEAAEMLNRVEYL
jgi:hypothetical protein